MVYLFFAEALTATPIAHEKGDARISGAESSLRTSWLIRVHPEFLIMPFVWSQILHNFAHDRSACRVP